ncbi:hypothetical protein [Actinoallomurus acaciae]|uniref:Uncharacterized protein n=1 Tax=Actinoallomurus acaciae TaxID=502577 RepID=A0ABV5YPU8_9ACTN
MGPPGTLPPSRRRSWPRTVLLGLAALAAAMITAALIYGLVILAVITALVLIMNGFGSNE